MVRGRRVVISPFLGVDSENGLIRVQEGSVLVVTAAAPTMQGLVEARVGGQVVRFFEVDLIEQTEPDEDSLKSEAVAVTCSS